MAGVFIVILILGWYYPLLGYFIPLCMLLGIGIGIFRGRKWCDWLCPRGSFYDTMIRPIPNVAILRSITSGSRSYTEANTAFGISPKRKIPQFFKSLSFRIGLLSFLMVIMIINLVKRWPDPYKIGMFFVILLTVTTGLGIILALFFHQRTWCCFCPIGSMANWVGRKRHPLKIDSGLCTECKLCYKVCPIQVAPFRFKEDKNGLVNDGDCLKCNLCISTCSQKALSRGYK